MENKFVPNSNRLVELCLEKFDGFAKTGKPTLAKEWTVLSAIVKYLHTTNEIDVVALGTGKIH